MRRRNEAFWICVVAVSFIAAACTGPVSAPDTPENRLQSAVALATMFAEAGAVDRALGDGADLATESTIPVLELELARALTDQEKARVSEIMRAVLAEFLTEEQWVQTVAETTAAHFTVAEIDAITSFYESPAGGRFMELEPTLSRDIDDRVGDALDERFDAFTARVDEELAKAFEGLSEGGE